MLRWLGRPGTASVTARSQPASRASSSRARCSAACTPRRRNCGSVVSAESQPMSPAISSCAGAGRLAVDVARSGSAPPRAASPRSRAAGRPGSGRRAPRTLGGQERPRSSSSSPSRLADLDAGGGGSNALAAVELERTSTFSNAPTVQPRSREHADERRVRERAHADDAAARRASRKNPSTVAISSWVTSPSKPSPTAPLAGEPGSDEASDAAADLDERARPSPGRAPPQPRRTRARRRRAKRSSRSAS